MNDKPVHATQHKEPTHQYELDREEPAIARIHQRANVSQFAECPVDTGDDDHCNRDERNRRHPKQRRSAIRQRCPTPNEERQPEDPAEPGSACQSVDCRYPNRKAGVGTAHRVARSGKPDQPGGTSQHHRPATSNQDKSKSDELKEGRATPTGRAEQAPDVERMKVGHHASQLDQDSGRRKRGCAAQDPPTSKANTEQCDPEQGRPGEHRARSSDGSRSAAFVPPWIGVGENPSISAKNAPT